MIEVGFLVRLVAKPGQEEALAAFLTAAEPLAHAETFTPVWFAYRADARTFYITDVFANADDRQKHLDGPIAAALMEHGPGLLAEKPEIIPVDVLVAKVPGQASAAA